ncbi:hypothetical protein SADO_14614 [Salinisphaera dokdonensis CL-ES53]|uniref:DUF4062 domain-containing protein n=1 Tax=Salinisphaera dokdonensis CL-ES53 TaxID=1304272 RepID=A0ABV2B3S7_9GAMM
MKVFISSVITGFESVRHSAREAVETLRHEPVMAEDFGAQPSSPQIACLGGVREADVVILVLGERYGPFQDQSGLSATHEEYREARETKPVLAFVQEGVERELRQRDFISEVQSWASGHLRLGFDRPDDLRQKIVRALHDYELATAVGSLDPQELIDCAIAMVEPVDRHRLSPAPLLCLSVVPGPVQTVLRPVEIESPALADASHQRALFGEERLLDRKAGTETRVEQSRLVLSQEAGGCVSIDENGAISIRVPLEDPRRSDAVFGGLPALIEEVVEERLAAALAYSSWLLDHADPTQRLSHVAVATFIEGSHGIAWRTREEHSARPNSITHGFGGHSRREAVSVDRSRPALRLQAGRIVEDLLVLNRRQWKKAR